MAALWDGRQGLREVAGPNKVAGRRSRLAPVPTTAGTGSEAGIRALVTDPEIKAKIAVEGPHLLADIALLDPELTHSVPPAVTAATGIDAMAHCVEAFTNIRAHDLIDGYARLGIGLVARYLARAVADGTDTEARAGMTLASYYGGLCLGPVTLRWPSTSRCGPKRPPRWPKRSVSKAAVALPRCSQILPTVWHRDATVGARGGARRAAGWAEEAHAIRRLMDNNPRDMSVAQAQEIYAAAL